MQVTIELDDETAAEARRLGVDIATAARRGIEEAVRHERAMADRRAYARFPETDEAVWDTARDWS